MTLKEADRYLGVLDSLLNKTIVFPYANKIDETEMGKWYELTVSLYLERLMVLEMIHKYAEEYREAIKSRNIVSNILSMLLKNSTPNNQKYRADFSMALKHLNKKIKKCESISFDFKPKFQNKNLKEIIENA